MQYSRIIWAIIYGFFIFNEEVDFWTAIGTAVIIAAGVYIVMREDKPSVSINRPVLETRSRFDWAQSPYWPPLLAAPAPDRRRLAQQDRRPVRHRRRRMGNPGIKPRAPSCKPARNGELPRHGRSVAQSGSAPASSRGSEVRTLARPISRVVSARLAAFRGTARAGTYPINHDRKRGAF